MYYVFVNQYTGEVQGAATFTIQRYLRDLHYYLFIPYGIGHYTVLVFGFMLFISSITALVFYKQWWRKLFELKIGNGPVVLFRSLHRLIGVWSVPFTILFSVTGIWYFLERTNTASISKIANTQIPKIEGLDMDSTAFTQIHYTIDYDRVVEAAQKAIPHVVVRDILPPSNKDEPIYVTGTSDVPLVRNRANRVYIHPTTYEIVGVQNAKNLNSITWLNDIVDPLHFGYWGGMATKIIWFLGGLGISFLVATGIWISLKRKIKNINTAEMQKLGKWRYPNMAIMSLMFGFMYYMLFARYSINVVQFSIITGAWIILILLTRLIYIKKIHNVKMNKHTQQGTKV